MQVCVIASLSGKTSTFWCHFTMSQIPKNEPVNDQKPAAAYLPTVLNNNKNNNKWSLTVKFCAQLEDLLHILRARF